MVRNKHAVKSPASSLRRPPRNHQALPLPESTIPPLTQGGAAASDKGVAASAGVGDLASNGTVAVDDDTVSTRGAYTASAR